MVNNNSTFSVGDKVKVTNPCFYQCFNKDSVWVVRRLDEDNQGKPLVICSCETSSQLRFNFHENEIKKC